MSQDDQYFRYMTHAGYVGGSAANYKPTGKKVKEAKMGIGGDLKDMAKEAWRATMLRRIETARDKGYERSQATQEAARQKAASEREIRKLQLQGKYFDALPKLFEDAVALGEKDFRFVPVNFSDVTSAGLSRYNPKSGTDAELILEILSELDLIADIEGNEGDARDGPDASVVVQV
jgi:hypothetical protein